MLPKGVTRSHAHDTQKPESSDADGKPYPTRYGRRAYSRAVAAATRPRKRRTAIVRSEWLDRSPGDTIIAPGFKQPGRKHGPAVYGAGLGPREAAMPLLASQRVLNYVRQTGRVSVEHLEGRAAAKLTRRQTHRLVKKGRKARAARAAA